MQDKKIRMFRKLRQLSSIRQKREGWRLKQEAGDFAHPIPPPQSPDMQCSFKSAYEWKERLLCYNTDPRQLPSSIASNVTSLHSFAILQTLCMASCYMVYPCHSSLRLRLGWGYYSLRLLLEGAFFFYACGT